MASLSSGRRGTISSERSQASSIKSIELPPNISPKIVALNGSGAAGSSSTSNGTHTPPEGQARQAEKTSVKDRLTRMFSQRSLPGQEAAAAAAAAAAHNGVNGSAPHKKPTPVLISQPQSQQNAPSKPQPSPQSAPLKPDSNLQPQHQPSQQPQQQQQQQQQQHSHHQSQPQQQQLLQQHLQTLPLPSDLALATPASSINGSSAPASSATSAAASPATKPQAHSSKAVADKATDKAAATSSNAVSSAGSSKSARTGPPNAHFVVDPNLYGGHEHYLKSSRRQEKLMDMFRGLLGKKPEQQVDNDLSLVSNWVDNLKQENQGKDGSVEKKAADKKPAAAAATPAPTTFLEKYGKCQEIVGRGAFGIVRISHKKLADGQGEKLFAVKEFRRRPEENEKKYSKRLNSEFCISSILRHPNIIHTLDLIKDPKGDYCEVMEYCAGGDLYTLVLASTKLEAQEADCYFKQMMRGVQYIHEMGVAHRDLKPENLLLTTRGALKITDFGNGECFRMAWESDAHMVSGLCGSAPYIAPEEYISKEFDARAVDVWACGVIYMAMRTGRHLWHVAKKEDDHFYARYLEGRRDEEGYGPIEQLHRARCRNVIYSILDPIATRRITAQQVLKSEWVREIKLCRAGEEGL